MDLDSWWWCEWVKIQIWHPNFFFASVSNHTCTNYAMVRSPCVSTLLPFILFCITAQLRYKVEAHFAVAHISIKTISPICISGVQIHSFYRVYYRQSQVHSGEKVLGNKSTFAPCIPGLARTATWFAHLWWLVWNNSISYTVLSRYLGSCFQLRTYLLKIHSTASLLQVDEACWRVQIIHPINCCVLHSLNMCGSHGNLNRPQTIGGLILLISVCFWIGWETSSICMNIQIYTNLLMISFITTEVWFIDERWWKLFTK